MIVILSMLSIGVEAQNYIQVITPRVAGLTTNTAISSNPDTNHVMTTIQYFDGLGRPVQTVEKQASPTGKDLVQAIVYDQYGRDSIKYEPYTISSATPGAYRPNAVTGSDGTYQSSEQYIFYQQQGQPYINTQVPYALTGYEPSPLNRVVEKGAPGNSWQFTGPGNGGSGNHTQRAAYTSNDQNEQTTTFNNTPTTYNPGSKVVALYSTVINSSTQTQRLVRTANTSYDAGQLYVTVSRDENWQPADGCVGSVEEYKDKEGHVVLKRTYNLNNNNPENPVVEMLSTYYVYDNIGNLAFVLPPQATPDNDGVPAQSVLDNLCYQYNYDDHNRLAAKKIPGKGWEYLIYNALDQVVATQDSVQRMKNPQQASYIKYDAQGRVIINGYYKMTAYTSPGANNRAAMQASADGQTTLWENRTTTGTGYSNLTIPTSGATALVTNYYDDYNIPGLPANYNYATSYSQMSRSLLTASKVAVINTTVDVLWAVHYFDDLGRETHTFKQHYLGGHSGYSLNNFDAITIYYNFTNQIDTTIRRHYTGASTTAPFLSVFNNYIYDHMQRKVHTGEQINLGSASGTQVYLSLLEYDELGQLKAKHYHTTDGINYLGEVTYAYNERGWLTSITPIGGITTFNETISYDFPSALGPTIAVPQYNGNISQFSYNSPNMEWHFGNQPNTMNRVNYTYDRLNRLTQSVSNLGVSDEAVTYNTNGNILNLTRTSGASLTTIVDTTLNYNYANTNQSNQLTAVTKGVSSYKTYTYDGNGNALSDGINRKISYNLLNLPEFISIGSTKIDTFTYDGEGVKLRNQSANNGKWDYIDGIVYENGTIDFIQTEEGKASILSGNTLFTYTYDFKDYLGNIRASFDNGGTGGTPRLVQEDDYYPFGLDVNYFNYSNNNRYLYNGKEKQIDLANQYDYGARLYDPVIARWTTVDPLSEKDRRWSPYNYVLDNPIRLTDPDGMQWEDKDGKGKNKKEADSQRSGIREVNSELTAKNAKLTEKIAQAKIKGNDKKVASLNRQIDVNNQRIDVNKTTLGALDKMEKSDKIFRFGNSVQTSETENGDDLSITSPGKDKDGTYVINNNGSLSNKAHEDIHGEQVADGLVDFTPGSTEIDYLAPGITTDDLEHQAYRANYGIDGDLGFGSLVPSVSGLDDPNFNNVIDLGKALKPETQQ